MGNAAISLVTQGFLSGCTPLAGFANLNLWSVIPPEAAGSFSTHTPGRRDPQTTRVSPPWWAVQDLNLRPHACEACALTTELTAQSHATQALNHSPLLGFRTNSPRGAWPVASL